MTENPPPPRLAFADESGSNSQLDPDTFILAAVICSPSDVETARDAMKALQLIRQSKVHWRDEDDKRQTQITAALAGAPLDHLVVVRSCYPDDKPERRRAKTMARFMVELDVLGVSHVTFESRGPGDKADRATLDRVRATRAIGSGLRIDHLRGRDEPLLWAADALCGTVTAARTGAPQFFGVVASRVQLIEMRAPD